MKEQLRASQEDFPEFDAVGVWREIIQGHMTDFTRVLPAEKLEQIPVFLAEMSRGTSRRRLGLYPYVREVLDVLRERYPLAIITDAQSVYAPGELHKVGLLGYFDLIVVSGDHGYIYGAREAGLKTVMFDSDQGAKAYRDCVPDYTITDFRDLLTILGLPASSGVR